MAPIILIVSQIKCSAKYEFVGWPVGPAPTDGWMTPQEAADYLRVHRETLLRIVRMGKIPYLRLPGPGKIYRFRREALERWAEARTLGRAAIRP